MASPQKENGYITIANELLEALARIRISGEARQVFDVIIRKTYGFNKKQDQIALSQFVKATGIDRSSVWKALKKLIIMELIIKIDNESGSIYMIQKNSDKWKPIAKKIQFQPVGKSSTEVGKSSTEETVGKSSTNGGEKLHETVGKSSHTKDTYTKDNTKDIVAGATAPVFTPKKKQGKKEKHSTLFIQNEEMKKWRDGDKKLFKIMWLYLSFKNLSFENWEQWDAEMGLNLRRAKPLMGYSAKQIKETMYECEERCRNSKTKYEWNLGTVGLTIVSVVNKK